MAIRDDATFAGSIPETYERYLVPLLFAPYGGDLAARVARLQPTRVLEIAAGTGAATRAIAASLPASARIVATDLNAAMLEQASAIGTPPSVTWRPADASALPFAEASFDVVACQFGAMFFPDKALAFAEARRVLRPRGRLLLGIWDRIEANEFGAVATDALATLFPADPPRFLARTPHGYADPQRIAADLAAGGFTAEPRIDVVAARSRAPSPMDPAIGYCQGTPLRGEIPARGGSLDVATSTVARAIAERFGAGPVDGAMSALVVEVER